VLVSRRFSIVAVVGLGYLYFRFSGGGEALAAIGLISFTGVVQVLPALVGGMFWRGATRIGAASGLLIGFSVWAYTMFIPSFGENGLMSAAFLADGPWGIFWLKPQGLFGINGVDPLVHAVFWSLALNSSAFLIGSLLSFPGPVERLQGAQFVNVFDHSNTGKGWSGRAAETEDLLIMAQRIIGPDQAQSLFRAEAGAQGRDGYLPDATPEFIEKLERELTGSVGAATAHAMLGQTVGGSSVSLQELMAVADEAAQILEYSNQLEAKSEEIKRTARQLRDANEKLRDLSVQKDAFLSQISHELRTPMTSIRAFSEILMERSTASGDEQDNFAKIIYDETIRLTRLLDDLLDLSVLENGQVTLNMVSSDLRQVLDRAVGATGAGDKIPAIGIVRDRAAENVRIKTDIDRLSQVFINLISNFKKYCDADQPELHIRAKTTGSTVQVDFVDNGSGIPKNSQDLIFEKFSRLSDQAAAGGAGLGLSICREIMHRLDGSIIYLPAQGGAAFRVTLPLVNASQFSTPRAAE